MILSTFPKCSEPSSETTPKACKTQKPTAWQEGTLASVWAFVSVGHMGQAGALQTSETVLVSQPIPSLGRQGGGGPERGRDRTKVTQQGHGRGGTPQPRASRTYFLPQHIFPNSESCIPRGSRETPSSPLLGNCQRLLRSSAVQNGSCVYLLCSPLCPSTLGSAWRTAGTQCTLVD